MQIKQGIRRMITVSGLALLALSAACGSGGSDAGAPEATSAAADSGAAPAAGLSEADRARLQAIVDDPARSAENRARDAWRHPVETLSFFGVAPDMTVVELWPFGGWYTEILAPYLREEGMYYAAAMDPETASPQELTYNESLAKLLASDPARYDRVQQSALSQARMEVAPAGSADVVLSFRNIHNWVWAGIERQVFEAAFRALKPGGVLGIVEHRHADPQFEPKEPGQAYVGEEYAVSLIESVGFRLAERSEINANPNDTKDHPRGVWTLPPTYAAGDVDRDKYTAIGESDRFTLRFVKPE